MTMNKMVPILLVSDFRDLKAFFHSHFGFQAIFESETYLGLSPEGRPEIEIAFMKPDNPDQGLLSQGLIYCFEVKDVDSEYKRLQNQSATILQEIKDNPWGDRSFIIAAPAGLTIYLYTPIPPAAEFEQYFKTQP